MNPDQSPSPLIHPTQPPTPHEPPRRLSKKLLVAIIVGIVLVIGVGVLAAVMLRPKPAAPAASSAAQQSQLAQQPIAEPKPTEAKLMSQLAAMCDTPIAMTNAIDYATGPKPHKVAVFKPSPTRGGGYIESGLTLVKDASWLSTNTSAVQLVACLVRKQEGKKLMECPYDDRTGSPIMIPLFEATYDAIVYEAKTGKKLVSSQLTATASTCPYISAYNKEDPKAFALPEQPALAAVLQSWVEK